MPAVDAYASEPHYADHIVPVWQALDPDARCIFWTNSEPMYGRLAPDVAGSQLRIGLDTSPNDRLTLVASFADLQAVRPRPVALIEHGAGQGYGDAHPSNPGGRERATVALFLCPNDHVAARDRTAWPQARVEVVGSPRLDYLARTRAGTIVNSGSRPESGGSVPCISFHWDNPQAPPESRWAFDHWRSALPQLAEVFPGVIGHAHPRVFPQLAAWYERAGIQPVQDFAEVLARADVYVCDNSSTIFEAAALGIPVALLDDPAWRSDVDLWPRFWRWADIGPRSADPQELVKLVADALADQEPFPSRRLAMLNEVYPLHSDGGAADRAARAVEETAARIASDRRPKMSSTDPYAAPKAMPPVTAGYDAGSGDFPERRLRRLGATDEQIRQVRAELDELPPAERAEILNRVAIATDDEVRRELAGEDVIPIDDEDGDAPPDGTIDDVLVWVGDDPKRAADALDAEQQGRGRKTLIEALERILG